MLGFFVRSETSKNAQAGFDSRAEMLPSISLPAQKIVLLFFVRVARIELASQPWEGRILPLYHTRNISILTNLLLFAKN